MEGTREDKLADLDAKKCKEKELRRIYEELTKELNELENDALVL